MLASCPELAAGLIVTMHIGPYQLLPEPLLRAGIETTVLLNRHAERKLRPQAEQLMATLGLPDRLEWLTIETTMFLRSLIRRLRGGRPVIVFLDGNTGTGGLAATREQGVDFRLPGREIRVRGGLGRVICKLQCPVHPLIVRWGVGGEVIWHKEPSQRWHADDDPAQVTRLLYDWGFGEVMRTPEQWFYWDMLTESYACFSGSRFGEEAMPAVLRDDFTRAFHICLSRAPQTVHLILQKDIEVWPGDVLANATDDRFYAAEGLQDTELARLRAGAATLAELVAHHGRDWVVYHGLRLCLLGLARLGSS